MTAKKKQGPEPNRPRIAKILAAERVMGLKKAALAHGVTQQKIKRWKKNTADDDEVQRLALAEFRLLSADWRKSLSQAAVWATDTLRETAATAKGLARVEAAKEDPDPDVVVMLLKLQMQAANDILDHMVSASAFPDFGGESAAA